MQVLALTLLVSQFALGYLFCLFLDRDKVLNRAERFFCSITLGLSSSSFLLLLLLLVTRSWSVAVPLIWTLLIASGILAFWKRLRFIKFKSFACTDFRSIFSLTFWGLFVLLLLYSSIVASVFLVNKQGFPSGILMGWGDIAYHLNMIGRLKTADPFLLEQSIASGERLTYPFMINLLSALYERIGFSKLIAWHLPVFLFGVSFFFLIFLLGKRIYRDNKFAVVLVMLVFFGAGIGFLWFFQDLWNAWHSGGIEAVVSTSSNPPHEYTHLDNRTGGKPASFDAPHNIVWIVPAISFLSHQRPFVSGASVAVLLFFGFLAYRGSPKIWRWGIVWGMIPFLHTHTFIAVSIVVFCWFFYDIKNWPSWLKGGILGIVIALPQIVFLMPAQLLGREGSSLFKPWIGWMTCTHHIKWYACDPGVKGVDSNPFWFWTKNFGFVFWVWIFAICAFFILKGERHKDYRSKIMPFIFPSILLFALPNVMLFQPWEFDNNKVLFYWWIFASICSLFLFQTLFESRRFVPFIFIIFVTLSVYSGMIDVLARIPNSRHSGYYNEKDVEISKWIRENTEPNDRFLTSDSTTQFIPMLTGRPIYLGFPGWLWSQGKNDSIKVRKSIAAAFLLSGDPWLICEDGIKYVFWDSALLRTYPRANYERVLSRSNTVFSQKLESEKREILEIKCPEY